LHSSTGTKIKKAHPRRTRLHRPLIKASALPLEVQEVLRKSREWEESFYHPAQRSAYIRQICDRIVERYQPEKIILFGSHAYGQPTRESDLDLLVVMPFTGGYFHQAARIRQHLGLLIPLDLLVRTPEQLRHRLEIGDSFMREIIERGRVMYEADHA
jgi:predicted nucleotidyltransferase